MLTTSYTVAVNPFSNQDEISILFSGRSQTEPKHTVGPQLLDYYLIHYVVSGKGTFTCRGKAYSLSAGSSFFIFPNELIKYESDSEDPWKYRWVAVRGEKVGTLLDKMSITPDHPIRTTAPRRRIQVLFAKILEILRQGNATSDLKATGFFMLLMGEYMEQTVTATNKYAYNEEKSPDQVLVEQAIQWLTLQHTQPITIDQMAQSIGYHRTYLSAKFKQYTGMTPKQFLLKIRMERARSLLEKMLSIKEVAMSVGFTDALYFSKQFKKWYGYTPTEYKDYIFAKSPNYHSK